MSIAKPVQFLAIFTFSLLTASVAQAGMIIDFESTFGSASNVGEFIDVGDYRFTFSDNDLNGDATMGGFLTVTGQSDIVEPGTRKLFAANEAQITMSRIDGGAFDLLSADIGGSFVSSTGRWASSVDILGGAPIGVVLGVNPVYQNVLLNYTGVTSVVFTPNINANQGPNNFEFVIDNLEVDAATVPEPSYLMLLGLSLIGLAFVRVYKA